MDLREVPPDALVISDLNERTRPPKTSDLVKSLEDGVGLVQPPIVRDGDRGSEDGSTLEVVVGQRRVLAARQAGVEAIPIVEVPWSDAEALEASITENIDAFREDVTDNERAAAVTQLMELRDESQREVARRLGVDESSVRNWLEGTREEWEGTDFEPAFKRRKHQDSERSDTAQETDTYSTAADGAAEASASVGGSSLRPVRKATEESDDPKKTREEMAHRVEKGDLNQRDVREIADAVDRGADVEEATERVERSKDASDGPTIGVQLTLPGSIGSELESRAEADGVSNEDVIRRALREYLGIEE